MKNLSKFRAEFKAAWHLALEYRVGILIWMLTMVLPLVMLAAWLSISRDGPVGRFGPAEFVTYYVGAIFVRNLTGVWIIWDLDADIRRGDLSFRLLKPVNPVIHYMAMSLASKPMRVAILVPGIVITGLLVPGVEFRHDPITLLFFLFSLIGTWALLFFMQYTIGLLGFWITQALALHDVWFALFSLFSGFLIPLDLFPPWLGGMLYALPFRYMLSLPVEIFSGRLDPWGTTGALAAQWAWVAVFYLTYRIVWKSGLKLYSAVGS